jgi:hypothetical protein
MIAAASSRGSTLYALLAIRLLSSSRLPLTESIFVARLKDFAVL